MQSTQKQLHRKFNALPTLHLSSSAWKRLIITIVERHLDSRLELCIATDYCGVNEKSFHRFISFSVTCVAPSTSSDNLLCPLQLPHTQITENKGVFSEPSPPPPCFLGA